MKLTIERTALIKTLGRVRSIVEKSNSIPILGNVCMTTGERGLQLRTTDLQREAVDEAAADIAQPGAATVPAHILYDIVRKLPDGSEVQLNLEKENERLSIASGRSRFRLQTLPPADFPSLSSDDPTHSFETGAADLKRLIDKTSFATSNEASRYYLNGIYLHGASRAGKAVLRAIATDGHRLAGADIPQPAGAAGMPGIILPSNTVQELSRLLDDGDKGAEVRIGMSSAKARFEIGALALTTKLIDGTYPDYQRVIPRGNDKTLEIDRSDFIAAVDRVSTIASERGRAVKLELGEGKLVLSVNSPEGGNATEEVGAEYGADPLEIGFNARYLIDIAEHIEGEKVRVRIADPASPIVMTGANDDGLLYVLMPMKV